MAGSDSWGIVSTVKAPARQILNFAAWHLELGASRLFIYLDDNNPEAAERLTAHPAITVTTTDDAHWQKRMGRRPGKHQLRQCRNAEHAYAHCSNLDWLAHIDVDEFFWSKDDLAACLSALPPSIRAARARPHEVLCTEGQPDIPTGEILCKAWLPPARRTIVPQLYPTYGHHFRGGFLSHVAGKLLIRTGQAGIGIRIHDIFENGARIADTQDLADTALIHDHASDWHHWLQSYRYRHAKGSYRPEMQGALTADHGGLTPHQVLQQIEDTEGEPGLRRFYDEMCLATPKLRSALEKHDALRRYRLDLPALRDKYFPE